MITLKTMQSMFVSDGYGLIFVALVVLASCTFSNGISIYDDKQLLLEEEKRGALIDSKKELYPNDPPSKGSTAKRGILPTSGNQRDFGGGSLNPPRYEDYESGRYGGTGGGYPPSAIGHYGNDHGPPPYYDHDGGYHHSGGGGGGYIGGRPSGYGPPYGPSYGPPPGSGYHYGGYEEDRYHDHSGPDQGVGGFKALTLKKIILPLAGLAILGVAAAASQNPVLLQLGSVNGRRKRSLLTSQIYPSNPIVKPLKTE